MNSEHLNKLEQHYRPCACRSTTPFFSVRLNEIENDEKNEKAEELSHELDEEGNYYRTYYQHDRDKILYSRSFRRLRLKTQIFPEHTSDHLRTRLDHTLEVAQIARHIARQLNLNEDLVDAIALGHDLGHTPFAHSGERALHRFLRAKECDGLKHNWQGLRVVDKLEKAYPPHFKKTGLDLTRAVRIGILKHTGLKYKDMPETCFCDFSDKISKDFDPCSDTCEIFEVQIARLADDFAQVIHDFEDAIHSDSLSLRECINKAAMNAEGYSLISDCMIGIEKRGWKDVEKVDCANRTEASFLLARLRSEMIFQLTRDVIKTAEKGLSDWEQEHLKASKKEDQIEIFKKLIGDKGTLSFATLIKLQEKEKSFKNLKDTLEKKVIKSERVSRMDGKADYTIRKILEIYLSKPTQVPDEVLERFKLETKLPDDANIREWGDDKIKELSLNKTFIRAAVDYVAGMTDRFALREFDQLYSAYPRIQL